MSNKTSRKRMKQIVSTFQDYVARYSDQKFYENYTDEIFIDDMIFGVGIALDKDKYNFAPGYDRWKKFLVNYLQKNVAAGE